MNVPSNDGGGESHIICPHVRHAEVEPGVCVGDPPVRHAEVEPGVSVGVSPVRQAEVAPGVCVGIPAGPVCQKGAGGGSKNV